MHAAVPHHWQRQSDSVNEISFVEMRNDGRQKMKASYCTATTASNSDEDVLVVVLCLSVSLFICLRRSLSHSEAEFVCLSCLIAHQYMIHGRWHTRKFHHTK